jgi:hypothetical protein
MWDTKVSCLQTEQMANSPDVPDRLLKSIPEIFYNNTDKYIVDKCRSWTLPANLEIIENYITDSPKIVVMLRPIVDIVKSFVYIRKLNGWKNPEISLLDNGSEPIMRSLEGVKHSMSLNSKNFLYIEYEDLVHSTKSVVKKVYDFYEWEPFEHTYDNINNVVQEKDSQLDLVGLHDIRPEISIRKLDVQLSKKLYEKAISLDEVWRK